MMGWISSFILAQFLAVILLSIGTMVLLIHRKQSSKHKLILSNYYQELLTNEMMELALQADSTLPKNLSHWRNLKIDRSIFHEVISNQMKMVTGHERELLVRLYEETGFKNSDLEACASIFWENRLNAVLHLGTLESPLLGPLFYKMIGDSDHLVSTAALLSLSKLKHPLNNPDLISKIPDSVIVRSNALYELITNIGNNHGVKTLMRAIRHDPRSRVVNASLKALRTMRTLEANEALVSLLKKPGPLSSHAILEIIETLITIVDPTCVKFVRPYLWHRVPEVRAKSALLLMIFEDPGSAEKLEALKQSPEIEIQRAFQIYRALQAGAIK